MILRSIIVMLIALPIAGFANCPTVANVKYGCVIVANQKHCSWTAAWYEGFPETGARPGDQALAFVRAYWSTANNIPPTPGHMGSTVCFYTSPHGSKIELIQNNWGGVSYPSRGIWTVGEWSGHLGKQCLESPAHCFFDYPATQG